MKKIILITGLLLLIITLISTIVLKSISSRDNNTQFAEKKAEDLNPISKESAIKVLKSEFGDGVMNTIEDIEEENDNYIIDVNINLGASEEHTHTEEELSTEEVSISEDGEHIINLGIHKINKYTGELVYNN
ncbi:MULTISPECIES: hypothetical protein [unclassified Romboutsia]|uniref:hypothetical protein n=1 Tax=unclassified Romboutsia TaxID=2626894 RepID=UPI000821258E|nr:MULTISPECIES: hypothetical protein [unclassified Romboutsia]SCH99742.1 Uncharacterised protein [uncultured Clostridium sp.]